MNSTISRCQLSQRVRRVPPRRQQGAVLLFCLIALTIMLIAAAGMVRSFQSTLFSAGNIGFKRDMRNQSELAIDKALGNFRLSGLLATAAGRANSVGSANYSAVILPTNDKGIPNALALSDSDFASIYSAPDLPSSDGMVHVRYVIDRMCSSVGDERTLAAASCVVDSVAAPPGNSVLNAQSAERSGLTSGSVAAVPQNIVYRITARVIGPRNTVSFFQSTLTVPSS